MKDKHGREIDYLRISITDRCNLRCAYCMPAAGVPLRVHDEILRYEEIERLVDVAAGLGFGHFRITGGEPLARRGAADFIARLASKPDVADMSLTTNGTLFAPAAADLRRAGLRRVNISLDTLDRAKYLELVRRDLWDAAWQGIEAALEEGFDPVKLNVVLMRGVNDDEIADLGRLSIELPLHVRFIELMPLGESCGMAGGFMSASEAAELLREVGPLLPLDDAARVPAGAGPAETFAFPGAAGTIGFIAAMSHSFCGRCNRLRLTADGRLHPCLASDRQFDLRGPLRAGAEDAELVGVFEAAVAAKPARHTMNEDDSACEELERRRMSRIGG